MNGSPTRLVGHTLSILICAALLALGAVGCSGSKGGTGQAGGSGTGGASTGGAGSGGAATGGASSGGDAGGGSPGSGGGFVPPGSGGASSSGGGGGGGGGRGTGNGGSAGRGAGGADGAAGAGGAPDLSCPGAERPGSGNLCRSSSDCPSPAGAYICTSNPGAFSGLCGAYCPTPPPAECTDDSGCSGGQVCLPATVSCCDKIGHACRPPCTATSCAATERCNSAGHCELNPCNEGFACPAGTTCNPGTTGADSNGCVPVPCTSGYDCGAKSICAPGQSGVDAHGCGVAPCSQVGCPVNFTCQPSATIGGCQRKTCAADADCDCGYCISGSCAPTLYTCANVPS